MTDVLVLDDRERCRRFVEAALGTLVGLGEWYQGISLERDGELVAAVIYACKTERDIVMHVAGTPSKRWLTHDFLRAAFRYPFVQMGLARVTAFVPETNSAAINLNKHLGFVDEGRLRAACADGDMLILGLLESECRWHGKEEQIAATAA